MSQQFLGKHPKFVNNCRLQAISQHLSDR